MAPPKATAKRLWQTCFLLLLLVTAVIASLSAVQLGSSTGNIPDIDDRRPHVCIIGGGIAGATSAYFLSRLTHAPRQTVFEASHLAGGRIRTLHLPNLPPIEAGATIIASSNRLMHQFSALLNLTAQPKRSASSAPSSSSSSVVTLWDGTKAVFRLTPSPLTMITTLLLRYGLSPLRSRRFVSSLLSAYDRLYPSMSDPLSGRWAGHKTVRELLSATDSQMYNLTQAPFSEVTDALFSRRFTDELVSAVTRVNYGQDVGSMNGLAGAVALAGSGADLWSVAGGNVQVPHGLLKLSRATLRLGATVTRVARQHEGDPHTPAGGRYVVRSRATRTEQHGKPGEQGQEREREREKEKACDAVVLALPVELAGIQLPDDARRRADVGRRFQRTFATFVSGSLNATTFGPDVAGGAGILTTALATNEAFTSLGCAWRPRAHAGTPGSQEQVWKVFSRAKLAESTLRRMFAAGAKVQAAFEWDAYPRFATPERFAPFVLDGDVQGVASGGRLFYTAAIESAGSAMEMSAVAGANVAALVRDRLRLERNEAGAGAGDGGGEMGKDEV